MPTVKRRPLNKLEKKVSKVGMKYDAVIFDMDGVILDSGLNDFDWMDQIRKKKASELGYDYSKDDAVQIVQSTEMSQVNELMDRKEMSLEEVTEIEHRVQNAKISLVEHGAIRLFSSTQKLLDDIDRPVGLATNSPSKTARFTLRYFGISDYFDAFEALPLDNFEHYITHKKPHSYMLEKVKEELDAENPLMVGDTSADIKAAENAGIDSVLVQSYSEYENLNPTHRIRNLDELRSIIHS